MHTRFKVILMFPMPTHHKIHFKPKFTHRGHDYADPKTLHFLQNCSHTTEYTVAMIMLTPKLYSFFKTVVILHTRSQKRIWNQSEKAATYWQAEEWRWWFLCISGVRLTFRQKITTVPWDVFSYIIYTTTFLIKYECSWSEDGHYLWEAFLGP